MFVSKAPKEVLGSKSSGYGKTEEKERLHNLQACCSLNVFMMKMQIRLLWEGGGGRNNRIANFGWKFLREETVF
jgi:hypothetical protein